MNRVGNTVIAKRDEVALLFNALTEYDFVRDRHQLENIYTL